MPAILEALPALYARLLPELFHRPVPAETKATCASCAMCASSCRNGVAAVDGATRLFRAETKCCTFHPRLPNYLVGALLAETDPAMDEGRRRVEAKIRNRRGVTPQWLSAPPRYEFLYRHASAAFGRADALVCPYYAREGGSCTIWKAREAVCSTFFCKYVAGADGRTFWMSLKRYLSLVEVQLSRYALYQHFPEPLFHGSHRPDAPSHLGAEDLDDTPVPDAAHAAVWGPWAGRERELYLACFDTVRDLGPSDVERLLGFDGELEVAVLERHLAAATEPALPRALKFNEGATVRWQRDGSVALASYSEWDGVALPGEAYSLLVAFDGTEPVDAVRARLRTEKKADLDPDVLLVLYQQRILVEADPGRGL